MNDVITPELLSPRMRHLVSSDPAHDWWHVQRVFRLGLAIFRELVETDRAMVENGLANQALALWGIWGRPEPEDEVALRLALICHDIGPKVNHGPNALVMDSDLRPLLDGLGLSQRLFDMVLLSINEHSWQRNIRPLYLTGAIVQDADRLDAIGAIGVARCFSYGGMHGRPLYHPSGAGSSLGHFDEKLLHVPSRLNLWPSQRMAEPRALFLEMYRNEFLKEWQEEAPRSP